MRPTVFLGHTVEDGAAWSARDREIGRALHLYESTLCTGCGHSSMETADPDREGWYTAVESVCAGCLALDKDRRDRKEALAPGTRVVAVLDPGFHTRTTH